MPRLVPRVTLGDGMSRSAEYFTPTVPTAPMSPDPLTERPLFATVPEAWIEPTRLTTGAGGAGGRGCFRPAESNTYGSSDSSSGRLLVGLFIARTPPLRPAGTAPDAGSHRRAGAGRSLLRYRRWGPVDFGDFAESRGLSGRSPGRARLSLAGAGGCGPRSYRRRSLGMAGTNLRRVGMPIDTPCGTRGRCRGSSRSRMDKRARATGVSKTVAPGFDVAVGRAQNARRVPEGHGIQGSWSQLHGSSAPRTTGRSPAGPGPSAGSR